MTDRTDRIAALGNAVVPQVGYLLGRYVMAFHEEIMTELERTGRTWDEVVGD